jgi:molecular chaperone HtpG
MKQGNLNVQTENILPIIKKFLYSEEEIFIRELISNATDATQKLQTLINSGEYDQEAGDLTIQVKIDKDNGTLHVIDRGVGMTEEEVERYINEIAFSSAGEFAEKFKDEETGQIIGKFGLGFYSYFMVSDQVEIKTLSYQAGAEPVKWTGTGGAEFSIEKADKEDRGTEIVLHISEENQEYLEEERIKNLLQKYCGFMPIPIQFNEETINDTNPIWLQSPNELTSQNYTDFYNKLYPMSQAPLFWIHLNIDYPFHLTGILYFPKINTNIEVQQNKIHLYSNQVFVTDNVESIVPEFLQLLHGVIDSPDIPLNVSRSYLQTDSSVRKISNYIVKKVSEKLKEIFNKDREDYEQKWDDIHVFIKYGMLTNDKFKEKARDFLLTQSLEGKKFTIDEYRDHVKDKQTDKDGNVVLLYATNPDGQQPYIEAAQNRGYDVLMMDHPIDSHFIQLLERDEENLSFKRVDAESVDKLIDKGEEKESALSEDQQSKLKEVFTQVIGDENQTIETEPLSPEDPPLLITQGEFQRRMKEMTEMSGMGSGQMPDAMNVKVNTNHHLAKKILDAKKDENKKQLAKQSYDLARLSQNMLSGKELSEFINRSVDMMSK